jgi:hypothetical protein
MATITVSSLLGKVGILLQDTTNVRWTQNELLGWFNDGQRELVALKPNAYVKLDAVQLAAGTRQSLPSDGFELVDVVRNMGADGATPGRAIRQVSREILDAQNPDWHSATADAAVKHFTYSILNPKTFYVYPPQPTSGRGYAEVVYFATPSDVTVNATVTLDDIYVTALQNYVLYRAYLKDAEYGGNAALSAAYYGQFTAILGAKTAAEAGTNPNLALGPMNPTVPGSQV